MTYASASQWTRALIVANLIISNAAFAPVLNPRNSKRSSFSSLAMAKRSERAFIEKSLEDAMNNDWRLFRAHLVAREQVESSQTSKTENSAKEEKSSSKQGDLGDMFADAISSIFSKKDKDANGKHDIFDGNTVGGASSSLSDDFLKCEDPFLSREELPILMNSKVSIDKRRWAHTIPHLEPGCVLVANEKLGGVFHQTVVLIIDHCESQGSNGIIINRYVEHCARPVSLRLRTSRHFFFKYQQQTIEGRPPDSRCHAEYYVRPFPQACLQQSPCDLRRSCQLR